MGDDGRFAWFGRCVDRCESYIERRFLIALLFSEKFSFEPLRDGTGIAEDKSGVILGQQVAVARHRLDFALKRRGMSHRIAIELDGFKFHDATPEQATRDRARDRHLIALGWRVARFSSREIIQDALGCARQAYELILTVSGGCAQQLPLAKTGRVEEQIALNLKLG